MCGIAGYFGCQPPELEQIQTTLDRMRRRGPDNQAYQQWTKGSHRCQLLHSRLSIIDLDPRSHQPLTVGTKSMVFNGELYNYREIRDQLHSAGYACQTESDSEVLVAAIDRFGWSVLDRLEGMWAFAIYDHSDGSLTLCRDRFGEKPLYVMQQETGIYFASEIKFLSSLSRQPLSLNTTHLQRFLVNGYKSLYKQAGTTFFNEVQEVPAASLLRFKPGQLQPERQRYWQPTCSVDESMTYEQAVEQAREHLIHSVQLRLRADVPIAFCMSGGVDSNSLISIAKRVFDYDVHGFTIVNTDSRYEEQDIVEQSVAELGIRHTNIPVDSRDFLPKLRTLVQQHDAPVYTITYFAHWLLMESVAQQGYRISVSGTAADELFTGYFDHHLFFLAEIHEDQQLFEAACRGWETHVKPVVRNPLLQNPKQFVDNPTFRDHMYLNADQFSAYLNQPWSHESFSEQRYTDRLLRNRMLNELFHEATPVILHEDDSNAMYWSIENRSPFLDRQLFDFCFRIPTRHLVRNGMAKVVLRDAMRGIVPDAVLDNPRKVGFNAPIFSFLDVHDSEVRASLLDQSPIFDMVRREKIEQMLTRDQLPNSESKFLFSFLSCKMFVESLASYADARGAAA